MKKNTFLRIKENDDVPYDVDNRGNPQHEPDRQALQYSPMQSDYTAEKIGPDGKGNVLYKVTDPEGIEFNVTDGVRDIVGPFDVDQKEKIKAAIYHSKYARQMESKMKVTKSYLRNIIMEELQEEIEQQPQLQPDEDGVVSGPQVRKNPRFDSFYTMFQEALKRFLKNHGIQDKLAIAAVRAKNESLVDSLFDPKTNPQQARYNSQALGAKIDQLFKQHGIQRPMDFKQNSGGENRLVRKDILQTAGANSFARRLNQYYTDPTLRTFFDNLTDYIRKNPGQEITNQLVYDIAGGRMEKENPESSIRESRTKITTSYLRNIIKEELENMKNK